MNEPRLAMEPVALRRVVAGAAAEVNLNGGLHQLSWRRPPNHDIGASQRLADPGGGSVLGNSFPSRPSFNGTGNRFNMRGLEKVRTDQNMGRFWKHRIVVKFARREPWL